MSIEQTIAAPVEGSLSHSVSQTASPHSKAAVAAYWPQLDGLRSLAFMLVFLHHLGRVADVERATVGPLVPALPLLDSICAWGWIGVDVFFLLRFFRFYSSLFKILN